MDFVLRNLPWFWLGLTAIFIGAEICTRKVTAVWFAAGAAAAFLLSMLKGLNIVLQIVVFLAAAVLLWMFGKTPATRILKNLKYRNPPEKDTLIMQNVTAVTEITETGGDVKDAAGTVHRARSDDGSIIPAGTVCTVTSEDGGMLNVFAVRNI